MNVKICIVGAGAIGGLIGVHLAAAGRADVSVLARGAALAALQAHGWRVRHAGAETHARVRAENDARSLGVQDVVVIAVKGQALPELMPRLTPLIGPETLVMPAMNGVPWWFCHGVAGFEHRPLRSVDPDGVLSASMRDEQVVGCVVHASASTAQPGVVEHRMGRGLIVGAAQGGHSPRVAEAVDVLRGAGFDVTHSDNIRRDIWYKLWGNMTINPISAITGATTDRVLADPLVRAFCSAAMVEAAAIGARIGCTIEQTPQDRHAITAKLGAFRTSMLQDVEAGRTIELDSLVAVVQEIGRGLEIATQNIDALLGLSRLFARVHGLYPEAV
ncbi:ketopantoate reductase [Paraburkholderia phenazinium]|uniref:2-dehydropantoate 2-reductase n=1 Tax=Paraburkholderia phenazinium TaxID=60549 RepID=A0A1N6FCJ3_9BURK|nr:ketopantoate reductase [Paraburkholderia phenazinium]